MGGVSMEWKEVRLGDIVSIKSGLAYKGAFIGKGENILLGMGCVSFKDKFLFSGARPYEADCDDKYCVEPGDIVLATRQQSDNLPILAMPAIIPSSLKAKKIIYGTNLYKVENHSEVTNDFLFWQLKTPDYIDYISSVKTGSVVRMVTKKNVEDYVFRCPPKEVRDRISKLLWGLDRKIELNNKINADLEEMAQAIFKNWFVDFEPFKDGKFVDSELGMIPEGWKVGRLEDIAEITMGQSPAGNSLNENREGMMFYQGSSDFGFRFPSIRVFTTEPKRLAVANSVLFSVRAPVGDINVAKEECCIGRGVASIKSKSSHDSYLFYTMKSLHKLFDSFDGEGTVFGSINKKTLSAIQILLPSEGIVEQFNDVASSFDNRIRCLSEESSRLSTLRDTLLPRLMSGEIEVPE